MTAPAGDGGSYGGGQDGGGQDGSGQGGSGQGGSGQGGSGQGGSGQGGSGQGGSGQGGGGQGGGGPADVLVGVLALQGDVREHVRALEAAGARVRPVRLPADLEGLDGLVVPGGESSAIGRLLGLSGVLGPLRALLAGGLPAYGSCAGMVLLAEEVVDGLPGQALLGGLDVTVRRNAFGGQVHSFETELPLDGLADPVHAVFIRAPWVERAGEGVEVLAEVDGHPVAVRQGNLLATSFHPELTGDPRVHALFVDLVRTRLAGQ